MDSKSLGPDHHSQFGIAFALQMARPLRGLDDHIKINVLAPRGDANQLAGLTLIDSLTLIGLQTLVF